MPIAVGCSSCQAKLKLADTLAGKSVKCPKCASIVRVPQSTAAATEPDDKPLAMVEELEEVGDAENEERVGETGGELSIEDDMPEHLQARVAETLSRNERLVWFSQSNVQLIAVQLLPGLAVGLFMLALSCAGVFVGVSQMLGHRIGIEVTPLPWLYAAGFLLMGLPFLFLMLRAILRAFGTARACYALTDRRAIVWTTKWHGGVQATSYLPAHLKQVRRVDSRYFRRAGDLIFDTKTVVVGNRDRYGRRFTLIAHYGFLAIDDVRRVEKLMQKTLLGGGRP